jgi:predicted nucleic acid-binding protein
MVTSSLVIAEGHGWFLRRYDSRRAIQFLAFIARLSAQVEKFDRAELAKADRLVKKYSDQRLTLADAHGLAVMSERRISICWSTDRHLGLSGVSLVI